MNYVVKGYEHLELSTQIVISEALKQGLKVRVLDDHENIIEISSESKKEYVQQATRTSIDTYIAPLLMAKKNVIKKILNENGIRVPEGGLFSGKEEAYNAFTVFKNHSTVVKPNTTNFSTAVTTLLENTERKKYQEAVDIAFEHDTSIIIDEFIPGKVYRFLVLGDNVRAVLHRVPANVTGDGKSTISELITIKNNGPLRGKGYRTPLENIQAGEVERSYIKKSGYSFDSVLKQGEILYLRENSNISTGGDSIDFIDSMPQKFKDLRVSASKAVGARICGADIIIHDLEKGVSDDNVGVIELNFNPALHIHDYPHKGKNRKTGKYVLQLLGF